MFYFYTGILYERKKRLSGFNATGHLILRIQPFLSIVNTDFDKNVECEMVFFLYANTYSTTNSFVNEYSYMNYIWKLC